MGRLQPPPEPIRVFLVDAAGLTRTEMLVMRGVDRYPGGWRFHAFAEASWAHTPVPPGCRAVAEPRDGWPPPGPDSRMHIEVEIYIDPAGVARFKPTVPLPQTLN